VITTDLVAIAMIKFETIVIYSCRSFLNVK
jgi:hypothetical protein